MPDIKVTTNSYLFNVEEISTDESSYVGEHKFTSSGSFDISDTFSGHQFPGYKSAVAAGIDATTSMTGVKYRLEGDVNYSYARDGFYQFGEGARVYRTSLHAHGRAKYPFPSPLYVPSSGLVTRVQNRAISKFLDSAKSARSSFEAGQDLGEIKQTIESFIHPMESLKKLTLLYFAKLKKAKIRYRDRISLHKALSDSYLEYRFGWRPLALDITDAVNGLRNRSRMRETAPCFGFASDSEKIDSLVGQYSDGSDHRITLSTNVFCTYQYRIKGAIRLNLDSQGRVPILQSLQLQTLNDFAVTAWDLLPYSFVVDYFSNLGDVVNALTFPTSDLTYCCGTSRKTITIGYSMSLNPIPLDFNPRWTGQSLTPANAKAIVTVVDRNRLSSIDLIPQVRLSLPVSSRPWENMAALISSNIKSLVPFFK